MVASFTTLICSRDVRELGSYVGSTLGFVHFVTAGNRKSLWTGDNGLNPLAGVARLLFRSSIGRRFNRHINDCSGLEFNLFPLFILQ
jgi:hypothetical protein